MSPLLLPVSFAQQIYGHQRRVESAILSQRETGNNACALTRFAAYFTGAAQFISAFAHREQSHACMPVCWQTYPIVFDFQLQEIRNRDANRTSACLSIAYYVGQCFLHNAIGCYFDSGW